MLPGPVACQSPYYTQQCRVKADMLGHTRGVNPSAYCTRRQRPSASRSTHASFAASRLSSLSSVYLVGDQSPLKLVNACHQQTIFAPGALSWIHKLLRESREIDKSKAGYTSSPCP